MIADMIARLVANGYGVLGTSIFGSSKASIPTGPGPYTSVIETGGTGPLFVHNAASPAQRRPAAQIVVRAESYSVALAKALTARDLLTLHNTVVNGVFYLSMMPMQEPFDLGLDVTGRAQVAFNVMAKQRPS